MKLQVLLCALSGSFLSPGFTQVTIQVPQDQPTIQLGIEAVANGDTVLISPGTYNEQIDLLGKAITVRSSAGAAATVIDSLGSEVWLNQPYGPVVRMINGEGPGTVLEGLTITGGKMLFGSAGNGGVWCSGLDPVLRDCVITGNSGGLGGGVVGNATLDGCVITGNDAMPYGDGGGVYGQPTILNCVITENRSGGIGGGVYATGPCTISDTVIDSNISGNGADGYTAGGVYGPATLLRCQITRNTAHHWFSGGPLDELGVAVDGAELIAFCTIADNKIDGGPYQNEPSGALRNVDRVENSILWNNGGGSFAGTATTLVQQAIVEGGLAGSTTGSGVLTADPLFADALAGDYRLTAGSPAIDAGDPLAPLDADGTVADLGAYPFLQFPASIASRNGSGLNPTCLSSSLLPTLGSAWSCSVDTTQLGLPVFTTYLQAHTQPSAGLFLPYGEVLVDITSPQVVTLIQAPVAGIATHVAPIPNEASLAGATVTLQAAVIGSDIELCNALDLTLGY